MPDGGGNLDPGEQLLGLQVEGHQFGESAPEIDEEALASHDDDLPVRPVDRTLWASRPGPAEVGLEVLDGHPDVGLGRVHSVESHP